MRAMFALYMFALTVMFTGCGFKLENNLPCTSGTQCLSGICSGNTCVGRADGADCTAPAECDSAQCEGGKCILQTCTPKCLSGDICLGSSVNRCAAPTGAFNGEKCYTGDRGCLSLKCDQQTNTCEPRSDGAFCSQVEQCAAGSSCIAGACQPTGSTCNPTCSVGQKCVSGTCVNVLLTAKDACVDNADCASGFCDAGPRNFWTCRAGTATCTPTCPAASAVQCGSAITPSNNCGSCSGTGTMCSAGSTCNGTTCVPTTVDGPALYAANCQNCHGTLASSSKKNRTAAQIQAAITNNAGGMGTPALLALTSAQVQAIATALVVNTCTPTYPAANTVTCGTPILPNNGCGTVSSGTGTFCATGTCNGTSCVTGGTGLTNGSVCTANNQCASGNCGTKFATNKVCLGTVDYGATAAAATDCHSGAFIAGTSICGPDQFVGCTGTLGIVFTFYSGAGKYTRSVPSAGAGKCVISDPTLDETSAIEGGDTVCTFQTHWTQAPLSCYIKVGLIRYITWNAGR